MKKFKKATAITMAATMALVPMNVLADTDSTEATVGGEGSIAGWIDTEQYNVTLPTTAADGLSFVIDPQGLTGVTDGATSALEDLSGGLLKFDGDTTMRFTNKSSFDVGVSVHVALESDDTGLKVVSSADAVDDDTERNIYIAVQQMDNADPADPQPIDGFDSPLAVSDTEGLAGEKKFAYALADGASEYEVSNTDGVYSYALKASPDTSKFATAAFSLIGSVNSNGDWSGYAKAEEPLEMNLEVSYSIDKLGAEFDNMDSSDFVDSSSVPGLLVAEKAPVVSIAPSAPATADFLSGKGVSGVYSTVISDVSVGKGDAAATDITSIKVGTTALTKLTAAPTTASVKGYIYDAQAKTLTLYGPVIVATAAEGTKANLTITFDDEAGTTQTIELTNKLR